MTPRDETVSKLSFGRANKRAIRSISVAANSTTIIQNFGWAGNQDIRLHARSLDGAHDNSSAREVINDSSLKSNTGGRFQPKCRENACQY